MSSKPRKAFDGVGRPKSPLDDLGKAIAKAGYGKLKKQSIREMKSFARSTGFAKSYERTGLEDIVSKKLGKNSGINTWKESTTLGKNKLAKTKENALALHKDRMYNNKQDLSARLYGDYDGPHQRFFKDMELPSRLNKQANKAFNDEIEIGRKQAQRGNKATARMLRPKSAKTKNTKGKR